MSVSVYTAMMIQQHGENIKCAATSDDKGKWSGQINFWKGDSLRTALIDTTFNFDSEEEALADMQKIVDYVRSIDIDTEVKKAEAEDKAEQEKEASEEGNSTRSDNAG